MKIELTEQEIDAVKEGIAHWDNDIIDNFRNGGVIIRNCFYRIYGAVKYNGQLSYNDLIWYFGEDHIDTGMEVKCTSDYCALCKLFYEENDDSDNCPNCPYKKHYGFICDNWDDENNDPKGHWSIFIKHKNIKTALGMRNSLARIIDVEEID